MKYLFKLNKNKFYKLKKNIYDNLLYLYKKN